MTPLPEGADKLFKLGYFPGREFSEDQAHLFIAPGTPFAYPNVYTREQTSHFHRLTLAPAGSGAQLLSKLAEALPEPFYMLYVLVVPRASRREEGRYQTGPLSRQGLQELLIRFGEFFDRDARHHVWLLSPDAGTTVVYDRHNLFYVYGALDELEAVAVSAGLSHGEAPEVPCPHAHNYHSDFDADEDELLSAFDWTYFPLVPEQDEE